MGDQLVDGKYIKNKVNKDEGLLIKFCKFHNLLTTNTIYKHKPIPQTTWISPLPPAFLRRNPKSIIHIWLKILQ